MTAALLLAGVLLGALGIVVTLLVAEGLNLRGEVARLKAQDSVRAAAIASVTGEVVVARIRADAANEALKPIAEWVDVQREAERQKTLGRAFGVGR